jgi:formylglycine-generating enzyme required for sulfatase activity/serine/threonine protein kinase
MDDSLTDLAATWLTPARYRQIQDMVEQALQCPPAQRRSFLASLCAGDVRLQQQAELLLISGEQVEDMGMPAVAAGTRIGAYEVIREINRGGMGAVYLARRADSAYDRQVAIKLVRPDMGGPDLLARFTLERRILASLDHPNIARLIDGGVTEAGQPFIVMEFIDGLPITTFADQRRLTVAERVRLFCDVCAAVMYAHQQLIIHRDLKPSNILVTLAGVPKLLDFGIAKLLTPGGQDADGLTGTRLRLGTPRYASPEQIEGDPIGTSSDVFALGVILYELLSGQIPPDAGMAGVTVPAPSGAVASSATTALTADGAALRAAVASSRQSTVDGLVQQLRGDLDAIVAKAIERDNRVRYSSVADLADDLRRARSHEPVRARAPTRGYVARKFVRRHRVSVIAAAVLVTTLVSGVAGTFYQWRRAGAEARRAASRFGSVQALATSILDLTSSFSPTTDLETAKRALVRVTLRYLEGLEREAGGDVGLLAEIADGYGRVGDLQSSGEMATPVQKAAALQTYRRALSASETSFAARPTDPGAKRTLAANLGRVGSLEAETGDAAAGRGNLVKSLNLFEELVRADKASQRAEQDLMRAHLRYADAIVRVDPAAAKDSYAKAREIAARLAARNPDDARMAQDLQAADERWYQARSTADPARTAEDEEQQFAALQGSRQIERYEYFLREFPGGRHAPDVRARLANLRAGTPDPIASTVTTDRSSGTAVARTAPTRGNPVLGLDLLWKSIPGGAFEMGCDQAVDRSCSASERPQHRITLSRGFEMTAYEITLGSYRQYAQAASVDVPTQPEWSRSPQQPVANVTWDQATKLCQRVGGRLPTEAEWERAAAGGRAGLVYPWGTNFLTDQANGGYPSKDRYQGKEAAPVGQFAPNGYGLFDMAGNVWEWVGDWFGEDYYASSPTTDPSGPVSGSSRVLRGGSYWSSSATLTMRLTHRGTFTGSQSLAEVGFRCVR